MPKAPILPVWLFGILIGLASIGLTLIFDRVTVASSITALAVRVEMLEKRQEEVTKQFADMRLMHLEILKQTGELKQGQQLLLDRQDEVRRVLRIR